MKKILLSFMLVFVFSTVIRADTFEFITGVVDTITDVMDDTDESVSNITDESIVKPISEPVSAEEKLILLETLYIIDKASLLTNKEVLELEARGVEINEKYNFDAVILTVPDIGNLTPMEYSSNFFHNNSYNEDGVVFLISMGERDVDISAFNYGKEVFTDDYGIDYVYEKVVPYLSDENYNKSFSKFLYYADIFLLEAESGTPYSADNKFFQKNKIMIIVAICALAISILVIIVMVRSMNTKKPKDLAHSYIERESINMTEKSDIFLYRTVTKTKKPEKESSSSSDDGGGSSTRSGGRSGKF